ncbi:hypothetical protein [Stigmatella erecta]|uniref:Uncharacterized protein n=1 Tax=Stigmatella erecta TaxID=83460 RepID=A0A1I0A5X2_9BACT|nr:hypothetical protein [Stigmatella erecta]SES89513.1 hypothetical protein SAMN05443639_101565 [Stigmatella erecta]
MRTHEHRGVTGFPGPRWALCLLPLLWACSNSEPGPPVTLTSVTPTTMSSSECVDVKVGLTGELPITLDYGTSTVTVDAASVREVFVGPQRFLPSSLQWTEGGFTLPLPAAMPEGKHDVRVLLSDGSTLLLPASFEVTAPIQLTGFTIDYVLDHYPDEPFTVVIRALGVDAGRFRGKVQLSSSHALLHPTQGATFQDGVLRQEVTLTGEPGNVFLQVMDCQGLQTQSNEFRLLAR